LPGEEMKMTIKRMTILLFCAIAILILKPASIAQSVSNQQAKRVESKEVTRWEHCAITAFYAMGQKDKPPLGLVIICFFQESGCREVTIRAEGESRGFPPNELYRIGQKKALSRAIAQLGNDGWELVGEMPYPKQFDTDEKDQTALYFKRRVP
jgi:hypothetical protein